jgi:anti-sigma regulatory factor (Ser/Thr protein kinase)
MEFLSYEIESNDFRQAGAASRAIKEHLKRIGAEAEAVRRTMISAYEAEMNVVIHSVGGRLQASLSDSRIDVMVIDDGPGIPDIDQAMTEGFSTASATARALGFGAGMGLPNIRRNSDRLRVTSKVGEGTRVSFTVYLRPETVGGDPPISLYSSADRCRDCGDCLKACPTRAMRVWRGRPSVLEHLCIDCTECIAACTFQALTTRDGLSSLDDLTERGGMVLAVPPALLAGCGPEYPPIRVLAALRKLGFADVVTVAPFEDALRRAALAVPGGPKGETAWGATAGLRRTMIIPSCPAVVNLIQLRFPSLVPALTPLDSPWEALQATYGGRPVAYVISCPSQRSALTYQAGPAADADRALPQAEFLLPETVWQAVMERLTRGDIEDTPAATFPADAATADVAGAASAESATVDSPSTAAQDDASVAPADVPFTVTGIRHVIAVLEQIENGLLDDVAVVEPYACEGGCFGSPLFVESHHVSARRWQQGKSAVEAATRAEGGRPEIRATPRRRPFAGRQGTRLDPDMAEAIQKLGRIQMITRSLPGRDCGVCGAPTCAALAEDVVLKRAGVDLCPYRFEPEGRQQ